MKREDFYKIYEDAEKVNNIIDEFHKLYYRTSCIGGTWKNTKWMGIPIQKNPMDLIIYQELIYNIKPDIIIETGTKVGGSALFFANICDIIDNGRIITIDIDGKSKVPEHERITYIWGNSVDEAVINFIEPLIKEKKVMVILDSDHTKDHVLKELQIYSEFVTIGSYIIVEDSNVSGVPIDDMKGNGPLEAIIEFINNDGRFSIDNSCEKFFFTFNPFGFLKRIK